MAAEAEHATPALAPLPLELAKRIFVLLPADCRARAACVARGWRDALADPLLWTRLDLSEAGLCDVYDVLDDAALLQGAARRALGLLCFLDISGLTYVDADELLPVLVANAGSLRELHMGHVYASDEQEMFVTLDQLVGAAPRLQLLAAAEVSCTWEEAQWVLGMPCEDHAWAPLRLRSLTVDARSDADNNLDPAERAPYSDDALQDAALQPTLSELDIHGANTDQREVLDIFVDAMLARRALNTLRLTGCTPPAAVPLARMLAGDAVVKLSWYDTAERAPLFDADGAALVADALRATTALTSLDLNSSGLCRNMSAAATVLSALVGHPSLRSLALCDEHVAEPRALGALLAALVAADTPALQGLRVIGISLGDGGLAPLVDALPRNRHLRSLDVFYNDMSKAFARERLLPAVRANTSLRELNAGLVAHKAQALVKLRCCAKRPCAAPAAMSQTDDGQPA
jgi:hypothetical protein